jgi:succinoglycan biosynthesis protein ExoM
MQKSAVPGHSEVPDHISVCICTFQRTELLRSLLEELQHQETRELFSISVVVVDNDFRRSAEPIVRSVAGVAKLPIEYYVEPIQNISLARNKAIREAKGNFVAFIDDDEIPDKNWLYNLRRTLCKYTADAALGPVLPLYKVPPPEWVIKGKFYERPTYRTGFAIGWTQGRTGNILMRRGLFRGDSGAFDPRFGSGGEDQDFTRRMIEKGHVFVWCNEARAYEIIPPARWATKNLLKRALLRGKMSLGHPTPRAISFAKALFAIPAYTMALPVLLFFGYYLFMQNLIRIFDHLGKLLAMMNIDVVRQKYIN